MGRYMSAAHTEPAKMFAAELDNTAVISEEFKARLWMLASFMRDEAYQRGAKEARPKKSRDHK